MLLGRVKHLLFQTRVKPEPDRYSRQYSIEECPDGFHLHWENTRHNLDQARFDVLSNAMTESRRTWISRGKPSPGTETVWYRSDRIPDVPGPDDESFRIELDDLTGPAVHVHLRGVRQEFSIPEFLQYADAIARAYAELRKVLECQIAD